jgi:hypothetical protein
MTLRVGVFDHIEPVPGLRLDRIYRERLLQIEAFDRAGFFAYHLAEHHTPAAVSEYMDEYVATGANYFVASFQWGELTHAQAMRSIELFTTEVMDRYVAPVRDARL